MSPPARKGRDLVWRGTRHNNGRSQSVAFATTSHRATAPASRRRRRNHQTFGRKELDAIRSGLVGNGFTCHQVMVLSLSHSWRALAHDEEHGDDAINGRGGKLVHMGCCHCKLIKSPPWSLMLLFTTSLEDSWTAHDDLGSAKPNQLYEMSLSTAFGVNIL